MVGPVFAVRCPLRGTHGIGPVCWDTLATIPSCSYTPSYLALSHPTRLRRAPGTGEYMTKPSSGESPVSQWCSLIAGRSGGVHGVLDLIPFLLG